MRIGALIDTHDRRAHAAGREASAVLREIVGEAVPMEEAGFHTIAVPDRRGRPECYFPGPESLLTVLATATARAAIGTFTWVATLQHPLRAAEQFAVIDQLSRGRLFVTASRGFLPSFWHQYGVPTDRMLGRFLESMEVWRRAFTGDRFDFHGRHFRVDDGLLAPPPHQSGGWPIWGGGNVSAAAIARSAEYASSWTCDPGPLDPTLWAERVGAYRERARALGKEPFVVLMRDAWIDDTTAEALREFGPHMVKEARFYLRNHAYGHHPDITGPDDVTADRLAEHAVVGDAGRCLAQVRRFQEEYGVDHLILRPRFPGGPDRARVLETINRLGAEVVGPVHRADAPTDHPAIPIGARW